MTRIYKLNGFARGPPLEGADGKTYFTALIADVEPKDEELHKLEQIMYLTSSEPVSDWLIERRHFSAYAKLHDYDGHGRLPVFQVFPVD